MKRRIIDNKPGAAGRVALDEVKRAAPDGNTLVLVAPSGALVILLWATKNLGYDHVVTPRPAVTPVVVRLRAAHLPLEEDVP